MKRRDFLSLCGLAAGSTLIPARIARLIRDTCVLGGQPLIIPPPVKNVSVLYAVNDYGNYTLHFGDPDAEPVLPTWQEFIESRGVDLERDRERFDFLEEYFGWDRSSGEPEPAIPLNDPIEDGALEFYMDWDFEMRESPMAQAFHYLNDLPLSPVAAALWAIRLENSISSRATARVQTSPMCGLQTSPQSPVSSTGFTS